MSKLTLDDYQREARATAIYPGELMYPTLGLAGEVGELIEAVQEDTDAADKEAGDIMWYVASVAHDAGLTLSECTKCVSFPRGKLAWTLDDIMSDIVKTVGKIAENVKKTYRDNGGVLTDKRRNNIRKLLGQLIRDLASFCANYFYDSAPLERVAKENLAKLKDRAARDVLKGDGNER